MAPQSIQETESLGVCGFHPTPQLFLKETFRKCPYCFAYSNSDKSVYPYFNFHQVLTISGLADWIKPVLKNGDLAKAIALAKGKS